MRRLLLAAVAGLLACTTNDKPGPPALSPGLVAADAGSPPPPVAGASSVGGPCWVSMVAYVDGAPPDRLACQTGLMCDYSSSVPDGPGRCKRP